MSELAQKACIPCSGATPRLKADEITALQASLAGGWAVVDQHHLEKTYHFKDFREALAFTNCVDSIAEAEAHHPDIELGYGRVTVRIHTHAIDGLSESDFILAAKIDAGCP